MFTPVGEDLEREMYELVIDRLAVAGYQQYEVSNFAQPAMTCRHNEAYWDCRAWEAFGPGAARFDGLKRTTNVRSVSSWIRKLLNGQNVTGHVDTMTSEEAAGRGSFSVFAVDVVSIAQHFLRQVVLRSTI